MLISESGVYSVGLMWLMRCLQSSPPIECAMKLTPRPYALFRSVLSRSCALSTTEAVLQRHVDSQDWIERDGRDDSRRYGGDDDFGSDLFAEDGENVVPVVHLEFGERGGSLHVEAIQPCRWRTSDSR
jgi:hypothetical protein